MTGPSRSTADLAPRRRRLVYRAWHRGTREMDLLMGSFCEAEIEAMGEADLDDLERLIDVPDPTLYLWISHPEETPESHRSAVLQRLQRSRAHLKQGR